MKKIILFCICVALFSCKKDHSKTPTTQQKKYPVTFDVSGFTQTIVNSTQKQVNGLNNSQLTAPANYVKTLRYWVLGGNSIIHSLIQYSALPNFGHIADSLAKGTYTIVIAAATQDLPTGLTDQVTPNLTLIGPWNDTFLKSFSFQVTGNGDLNQAVTLDRILGQLEIQVKDTIPANATFLNIAISSEYLSYSVATNNPVVPVRAVTFTDLIPGAVKGTNNYTIDHLIGNTVGPFSVTLTCLDDAKNIIGSTIIIPNVTCKKNTRTILRGNLFSTTTGVNVNLNSGWSASSTFVSF